MGGEQEDGWIVIEWCYILVRRWAPFSMREERGNCLVTPCIACDSPLWSLPLYKGRFSFQREGKGKVKGGIGKLFVAMSEVSGTTPEG